MQTPDWSRLSFGGRLSEPARHALVRLGVPRALQPGEPLVQQGERGSTAYLVLNGRFTVTMLVENGTESLLNIRHPGDLIGEIASLGDGVRTATVTAREPSTVLVIPRNEFLGYLGAFLEASLAIHRMTADRLTQANAYRADAAGYEVEVRLARALLYQSARMAQRESGGRLCVALKQSELAMLIGAKEGTVQKAMKGDAMRGIIQSMRGRVLILDVPRLAELAEMAVPEELA